MTDETGRQLELLERIEANTRSCLQILILAHRNELNEALSAILGDSTKLTAYRESDGSHSAREVARRTKTSHKTIGRWWDEWKRLGLMHDTGSNKSPARHTIEPQIVELLSIFREGPR